MKDPILLENLKPGYLLMDLLDNGSVCIHEYRVGTLRHSKPNHYSNLVKDQAAIHVERLKEALKKAGYKLVKTRKLKECDGKQTI